MQSTQAHDVNKSLTNLEQVGISDTSHIPSPEICVICLDRISEKATALPCRHDQFDFPCLGTWIQEQQVCPLCKREVHAIQYGDDQGSEQSKIFNLPPPTAHGPKRSERTIYGQGTAQDAHRYRPYHGTSRRDRYARRRSPSLTPHALQKDGALEFRRQVYRLKMYSLHVGTNRISKYRNITPSTFLANPDLVGRAKTFVRRELSVFDFLNPSSASFGRVDRRASNAEFLLEYVVSILKSVDLKASTGQAEELLKDFLGRANARLFLHELEAWLRSPYERLIDWDRHVQYEDIFDQSSQ